MLKNMFIPILLLIIFLTCSGYPVHSQDSKSDTEHSDVMSRMLEKKLAEDAEKKKRTDPAWNFEQAKDIYDEGDYQTAAEQFDYVLQLDARFPEAASMRRKAKLMFYFGRFKWFFLGAIIIIALIKLFELLNKHKKGIPKRKFMAALENARRASGSNSWKTSIDEAWKARRMTGVEMTMDQRLDIHLILAKAYAATNKYEDAIREANQAVKIKPNNPLAHEVLVSCYVKTDNRSQEALREYKRWFKEKPSDRKVVEILTQEYIKIHLVNQDAMDVYRKMLSWEPKKPEINRLLAESYLRKGEKTPVAMSTYEIALEQEPDNMEMRRLLFECYASFSRNDDALKQGKILLENGDKADTRIHKVLIETFEKAGKHDEMLDWYRDLQSRFPDEPVLLDILERVDSSLIKKDIADSLDKKGPAAEGSPAFNICPDCAHLNPAGSEKCEGCGAPVKQG